LLYGPLETQNHVLIAPLRLKKMEDVIIWHVPNANMNFVGFVWVPIPYVSYFLSKQNQTYYFIIWR
jgi:hypothetical protein